ncbi:TonB-dependent receptor [Shewanella baltica]|uniref:TonB-dependent receptor n=1 Tax=Shewanella baltica TaxID=62322 RepID=UPI00217E32B3|nr:TonB-dependent receptor [Shewanella baltica]MCS6120535.1 TonB-dependent receptor [Shewanella baltica]
MNIRKKIIAVAIASALGMGVPSIAYADNTTASITGSLTVSGASASEYTATAKDPKTGLTRNIEIGTDGTFRFSKLPVGTYEVAISKGGIVVAKDTVSVSLGSNANATFDIKATSGPEVISIVGARINNVDLSNSDSGLVIDKGEIDLLPVARNFTSIALLAPGTVAGDSKFGQTASFGGSSAAENSCYINGLEVTNTSQGLGCGEVPFEFYREFQVKTGGYSAQFGRTTGGVINAVTKSGTNEWDFAATGRYIPKSLASEGQISRGNGGVGAIFRDTTNDEYNLWEYSVSAAGPIIEDKLFFYAIVNPRNVSNDFATQAGTRSQYAPDDQFIKRDSSGADNLFWGAKVDWNITDDHSLSFFGYSNRSDTNSDTYAYDAEQGKLGNYLGSSLRKRGGTAKSVTYNGNITDDLSLSVMYGKLETEYTTTPSNLECPTVSDSRQIPADQKITSCGPGGSVGVNVDENTQTRVDLQYVLGDHLLKAGYDKQERFTSHTSAPITGHSWTYSSLAPNAGIQGTNGNLYTNTTGQQLDYVQDRIFAGGGGFNSDLSAWYLEDSWQVTDNVMLTAGVRQDKFDNQGVTGLTFSSFKTDLAPRLGFTWDPVGDGESKIYGTAGRYYLPVPNNTNYRAASGISDSTTFYTFTGHDNTGAPTGLNPIAGANSTVVNSVPTPAIQETFQSEEAEPFSKDEYILGYQKQVTEEMVMSVRGIYREVGTALDDYCGPLASQATCTLVNPGSAGTWSLDNDGDAIADPGSRQTYSAEEIGLPKAENTYKAIQAEVNYTADNLRLNFIYTWSKSYGNFEGAVKSDIGQADPGVTQDFDFPALMDGAEGYQANDRRHVFKLFGTYNLTDDLSVGFNSTLSSGRPLSAFGQGYPNDDPSVYGSYGDTFYLYTNQCPDTNGNAQCDQSEKIYNRVERGTVGRTPWNFNLDLSLNYDFKISDIDMRATVNVYNVLDIQEIVSQNEHYEARNSEGTKNQYYGAAYDWQEPRYVEFGISGRF